MEEGGICRCCQAHGIFASLLGTYDLGSLKLQPPERNSSRPKTKLFNCFCIEHFLSGVEAEEEGNDWDVPSDQKNKDVFDDIDMNNISPFSPYKSLQDLHTCLLCKTCASCLEYISLCSIWFLSAKDLK